MKYYSENEFLEKEMNLKEPVNVTFGCGYCWDGKRKKEKSLFFLDAANNMRPCLFCPSCGREYMENNAYE